MNHVTQLVAVVIGLTLLGPATTLAQESGEARARRILDEAQAHEEAQRYAIAAQRYLELYDVMREAELQRAPVALWSAGFCLSHLPGQERDARDALRRFLEASTALAQEAVDIQRYRSESINILGELDARQPTAQNLGEPASAAVQESGGGSISPVGPIILGVGGATLLAGVIVAGLTLAEDDSMAAMCMDGACPEAARGPAQMVEDLALATDVLLIGGGIIAATGLLLTLLLHDEHDSTSVTAACGTSSCGITLAGEF